VLACASPDPCFDFCVLQIDRFISGHPSLICGGNTAVSKGFPMKGIEYHGRCKECINPHNLPHAKSELPRWSIFFESCAFGVGAFLVSLLTFSPTVISPEAILLKVICLVGGLGLCVGSSFLLVRDLAVVWGWWRGTMVKYFMKDGIEHLHEWGGSRFSRVHDDGLVLLIGRQPRVVPLSIIRGMHEDQWCIGKVFSDGRLELLHSARQKNVLHLFPKYAFMIVASCDNLGQLLNGKGREAKKLALRMQEERLDLLDGANLETVLWHLSDLLWIVGQPGPNQHWKKRVQAIREHFWSTTCWMFDENDVRERIKKIKMLREQDRKTYGESIDACPHCSTQKNTVYMKRLFSSQTPTREGVLPAYKCIYCNHTTRPPAPEKQTGPVPCIPRSGLFGG
jgi:hypothetical protein